MAFVTNMFSDKQKGAYELGSFYHVEEAIRGLDGDTCTQIVLEGDAGEDGKVLMIGGGNEGRYNVFIAINIDQEFYNLLDPKKSEYEHIEIVTGGQAGMFPANKCVDLPTVLKAAKQFFESGEPAADLAWEHE